MTHTTTPVPQPGRRARRRLALLATAGLVAAPLTTGGAPALAAAPAPAFGARTSALTSAVPAALASALPAAAVGKLARRGCTAVGAAVSCDLYAMAGTTSMNGGAPINIWGFSATDVAGMATAPGPLLVVNEGDTVTMTLHNSLAGQSVSLALPGQAVQHAGSVGDDTVGVGVGGSTTYTFTASHPGTFSYEAGHTAQGARQVAMGLAGALVVLPADGTAYGKAYDDDAVLVLSEIDPALNANPATFDMRVYTPKYALINGKPFPAADPISTDQGHTVLLRYVNVGSQTHPMSLLGADQTRLASDAVAMTYPEGEVTEAVDPGETAETLVTMPTGPEAKVTVYDASQHLDNNHQSTADPLQTSFGGMMTFLDTAAPPPSSASTPSAATACRSAISGPLTKKAWASRPFSCAWRISAGMTWLEFRSKLSPGP